jgi:hypothetical protein
MQFVQDNLCVRLSLVARLLMPLVLLFVSGSVRGEVIYGPFEFQQESDTVAGVYQPGWQVTSEPMTFCNLIFLFNGDPAIFPVLYSAPDPLPNAADHGLPVNEYLFLGPSLNASGGDILYRVASNAPTFPGDPQELGSLTFATTGSSLVADSSGFSDDLYSSVAGGGKYLATNFAADYTLTAADFANESEQAVLFYDPMDGNPSAIEGQFTGSSGYVGFRFLSGSSKVFYGWLHITDISTSVSNPGGSSDFGFIVDSFAIRAATGGEPDGIKIGSATPGAFSAVPEPGTYGVMLVLGVAFGLRVYRRRRVTV